MKECQLCLVTKEISAFNNRRTNEDGKDRICKDCRKNNKQECKKLDKHQDYLKNKDVYRARAKKHYADNVDKEKENRRENYLNNRDAVLSRRKKYYENNKDKPTYCFSRYKQAAKDRKKEWSLSFDEFMVYWQKPCTYCNDPIATIGLDRIDSSKGYEPNNIVPCCGVCNWMKLDMSKNDFYQHIKKIVYGLAR